MLLRRRERPSRPILIHIAALSELTSKRTGVGAMAASKGDARHWHQRAAQARARAARIMDDSRRARQISKAEEYDRLAEEAQRLLVEDHS